MLLLSASLLNKQVLSLRTNSSVAKILSPIINPDNLKIEGFYVIDQFSKKNLILVTQDIRDIVNNGYIVNDHDVLVEPEDLVRLQKVLEINFELIGKQVITISKDKVGKVSDYAAETSSMYIQKLYVSQSLLKSFTGGNLSIDRNQINEITPKTVIINELMEKARVSSPIAAANTP